MAKALHPILCFDLETTGLGKKGERVVPVQIAAMIVAPTSPYEVLDTFSTFIQIPMGAVLEPYAMNMHLQHNRDIEFFNKNGLPPIIAYSLLWDLIRKHGGRVRPAGHNVHYDVGILIREALHHGIDLNIHHQHIDTATFETMRLYADQDDTSFSLGKLAERHGCGIPEGMAHDAGADLIATLGILRNQLAWFAEAKSHADALEATYADSCTPQDRAAYDLELQNNEL